MILDTEIHGIPCRVRVTHYRAAVPGRTSGPVDLCYPSEPAEVEFEILDEAGRPDPELEATMDSADVAAVEQEIIAAKAQERRQELADLAAEHYYGEPV